MKRIVIKSTLIIIAIILAIGSILYYKNTKYILKITKKLFIKTPKKLINKRVDRSLIILYGCLNR